MNNILDDSLVGLVLLASVGYALMSLGPRGVKRRMMAATGGLLARMPAVLGLRPLAQRLNSSAAVQTAGACGGCDNCGSAQSTSPAAPAGEIKVPLTKIGRRAAR